MTLPLLQKILKRYCIFSCTYVLIEMTPCFIPPDKYTLPNMAYLMYISPLISPFMLVARIDHFYSWFKNI